MGCRLSSSPPSASPSPSRSCSAWRWRWTGCARQRRETCRASRRSGCLGCLATRSSSFGACTTVRALSCAPFLALGPGHSPPRALLEAFRCGTPGGPLSARGPTPPCPASSTVAAVINQSQPLFTATLAVALGLEEASLAKGVGVVLAAGGAVVVVGPGTLEHPGSEATGILMVAGSALCMACYFIVQKPALRKYPPLTITAWAYGAGTVLMGGTVWAAGALGEGAWEPTSATWLALAFAVALNSVAKYSLQSYAIAEVEASTLVRFYILAIDPPTPLADLVGASACLLRR
mmetsp:Transcript_29641/g.95188  ORF Transcript_29641/g.95188 Transcript_29641/m.95188 type:complete len:291 (-) Transcript_29641:220-1092(-)